LKIERVLILGSTGLAGQAFYNAIDTTKIGVVGVARKNSDLNSDISNLKTLEELLSEITPSYIINCAALTDLKHCENNWEAAWSLNAMVPAFLAQWSSKTNCPVLHISTDHFFSDINPILHSEEDKVSLKNEYARSKYAGECLARLSKNTLAIRTSIIGKRGWASQTFAEWAYNGILTQKKLNLFDDSFTSSIAIKSFVKVSLELFFNHRATGLFNIGSCEVYSKADFVLEMARQLKIDLLDPKICSIEDFNLISAKNLGLNVSKAENILSQRLPTLEETVSEVIDHMVNG
jgi:dTDP-4-dehydrorhamnose reductase